MRLKLLLHISALFLVGMFLQGCGITNAQMVTSELIHSEKTLPIHFYEHAEQGVLVYKVASQQEFDEQWAHFRLTAPPVNVDWNNQVVIFLGIVESGTCPLQFKSANLNEEKTEVLFELEGDSEAACTDDATPRTMVIAMDADEVTDVSFVSIDDYFGIYPEVEFQELTLTKEEN